LTATAAEISSISDSNDEVIPRRDLEGRLISPFKLPGSFISSYISKCPPWGPLGEVTYKRTYAREVAESGGRIEEWWETVQRVVEGEFNLLKIHLVRQGKAWRVEEWMPLAQRSYEAIFWMRILPPGRGLWAMGTEALLKKGAMSVSNCGFVSTKDIDQDLADPFRFAMDASMLGAGMGVDARGRGKALIYSPQFSEESFEIEDSREGWLDAYSLLLRSFTRTEHLPRLFDARKLRGAGAPLKTFGGKASGPAAILRLLQEAARILLPPTAQAEFMTDLGGAVKAKYLKGEVQPQRLEIKIKQLKPEALDQGFPIRGNQIRDLFNVQGVCVVMGGIRRSSYLQIGSKNDQEFLSFKDPHELNQLYSQLEEAKEVGDETRVTTLEERIEHNPLRAHRWSCVTGDTMIATRAGTLPISSLVGQTDIDILLDGVYHRALGIKLTGNKPVHLLRTWGGLSLKATENHLLMTTRGWVKVQDLDIGKDRLVISNNRSQSITIDYNSREYEHGYLIGALIGNGAFIKTPHGDIASIQFCAKEPGCKSIIEYIESIFKFQAGEDWSGLPKSHDNANGLVNPIVCKNLSNIAAKWGVVRGHRVVNNIIESGSVGFTAGILSGIFDVDGYTTKQRKTLEISSINISSLESIQRMLLRLGIVSRINTSPFSSSGVFSSQETCSMRGANRLVISGYEEVQRFISVCSPKHSVKYNLFSQVNQPVSQKIEHTFKVISSEYVGYADVFDICVPGADAFSANGLYVHNSNNSEFADGYSREDYRRVVQQCANGADTGLFWLENSRRQGRAIDPPSEVDRDIDGVNACGEMSLVHKELCNVLEVVLLNIHSKEEFLARLEEAYLYGKVVTTARIHDTDSNRVNKASRRMGISLAGVVQAIKRIGTPELIRWLDAGYKQLRTLDAHYSEILGVPLSRKLTTIKPGGTVPLLPGATSGGHAPLGRFYVKNMRIHGNSPLLPQLRAAGYPVERAYNEPSTEVVSFPVQEREFWKSRADLSVSEQFELLEMLQRWWSDNSVSVTIEFTLEEQEELVECLMRSSSWIKAAAMFPRAAPLHMAQLPLVHITEAEYRERISKIRPIDFSGVRHEMTEAGCEGEHCILHREMEAATKRGA